MKDGALPASAQRVQDALKQRGFDHRVVVMPATTRTAAEAAEACKCTVAQIAKSLIFRAKSSDRAVMVITSGANRVNEKRITRALGEKIGRADADFVRARTGFAIGGVAPIGHRDPVVVFIDRDLMGYDEIWAAAGTPSAVFKLTPDDLVSMTGGEIVDVT